MSEGKGVKFLKFLAEHGLSVTLGLAAAVRIYLLLIREYVIGLEFFSHIGDLLLNLFSLIFFALGHECADLFADLVSICS